MTRPLVPISIAAGVVVVGIAGALMVFRAESKTNKAALSESAKPVSATPAKATTFRPSRAYVGTVRPWIEANVGPQLVSAYVDTVLVRPGAVVKRGDVLATLDCRNVSAESQAIASTARAIEARQRAMANESARVQNLLDGGFVSPNEAEQKMAQSVAEQAQLDAQRAQIAKSSLEVNDCILRAPFDGEVARRLFDPGAFARPGTAIVTVVDRATVRMTADAPESDSDVVAPQTKVVVHLLATNTDVPATISRRAPGADLGTRTIHFEMDIADPDRKIMVDTTGEVRIDVGEPMPSTEIPVFAASTNGEKATVFVVEGDVAHAKTLKVRGERGGSLFFDPKDLPAGAKVVTEGRALLTDGDKVDARIIDVTASGSGATVTSATEPSKEPPK
jgi:RND family efflux transporter MFP subunit